METRAVPHKEDMVRPSVIRHPDRDRGSIR